MPTKYNGLVAQFNTSSINDSQVQLTYANVYTVQTNFKVQFNLTKVENFFKNFQSTTQVKPE